MGEIRLGFADTYENAKLFFTDILSRRYQIIRDDVNPEYLIFGDGNFGNSHNYINARKKIFFTGENVRPNWNQAQHAITFDHENSPRHYRLPLYVLEMWAINHDNNPLGIYDFDYLTKRKVDTIGAVESRSRLNYKDIAYIQSNPNCQLRNAVAQFFDYLKMLDSAGPHMNNTGYVIPRDRALKMQFYSEHFFGMAMENGSHPGYVTEKLIDCYYANTVPIYWGSETVSRDFNPRSFINVMDYREENDKYRIDDLRADIAKIVMDEVKYSDMLSQPAFNGNRLPDVANIDNFLNWWETFVE